MLSFVGCVVSNYDNWWEWAGGVGTTSYYVRLDLHYCVLEVPHAHCNLWALQLSIDVKFSYVKCLDSVVCMSAGQN